jgi:hypothetical protein
MSAPISFKTSAADQKNWVDTGKKVLGGVNTALGAGCSVGTVVSIVAPVVAPATGVVCAASAVTGVADSLINKKK